VTDVPRALRRVLVVGASLAGVHAATTLRREGFSGDVTVLGAEPHLPYDRPPLTKQLLHDRGPGRVPLPGVDGLDVRWQLGDAAVVLDPASRTVHTARGDTLAYDGLVIATGALARPWRGPGESLHGVHTVRSLDDAIALRRRLDDNPAPRVVIVGGGFVGAETAAASLAAGCPVTVVEQQPQMLAAQVGPLTAALVGPVVGESLHDAGADVRLGVRVVGLQGSAGRLTGVRLDDGHVLPADLAVVGLGARPATDWLRHSGAVLRPQLLCDARCQVVGLGPDADVVAAGDVTAWPNPLYDNRIMTVEHWSNAREQAEAAIRTMLAGPGGGDAYAHVPSFWSDIGALRLRTVGLPALGENVTVVDGSPEQGAFLAVSEAAGRTVGAVSLGRPRHLPALRAMIVERVPFDPARLAPPARDDAAARRLGRP
jgi:3-phenylpropionate/trans-cinnamate dioxygenase ferredoxin reductase component